MSSKIILNREHQGELLLLSSTLLWGLFPVITILSFSALSPLVSAGISTLIAALVFAAMLTVRGRWKQLLVTEAYRDILLSTLLIGVALYGLIFLGASYTSANNMAIILLLEIFFTQLILGFWGKESMTLGQRVGSVLMVLGALVILFPGELKLNRGDLILVFACCIPPLGNYFMQQARKRVASETIMFVRSTIGGLTLLCLGLIVESEPSLHAVKSSLWFLIINGILLLGVSKILWIEAIHRISISKASALSAVNPLITMVFAYLLLSETPTSAQLIGFIPIALGLFFLTKRIKIKS